MASLRQIRRRMKSIENIHEITKAMEMIAAFRFKKSENRFSKELNYFSEMETLVSNLSGAAQEEGKTSLMDRQALFVVQCSDKPAG